MSTDAKKLKCIQNRFFTNEDFPNFLKLHTLHDRRLHFDALFFVSVYSGLKCCASLLDTTGIQGFPRNFRNSSLFTATCKISVC
jgi:hypothetical protein